MVQTPRHCPRCNTPFAENQRICARCGFNLDASLSGLNAPQEPYPGQPATQSPQFQQISQHPLPPASRQVSQHPLPPASQQVSQHPLPPASQQVSQHPLPPASRQVSQHPLPLSLPQVSQHPLPPASQQVSQHPLPPVSQQVSQHPLPPPVQQPSQQPGQQQQISQHPETRQADEIPTQAQPAVNPASSPQPGQQQQISQHPETLLPDEIPTQAQPTVKPTSSPQWANQQISQHPETRQADEIPTQAQPMVNPTSPPQSRQQQASLHPETMQPTGQPASSPQWGQQASLHPETMQSTGQPASSPQWGQQASLHPETMQSAGQSTSSPQWGQQASLHPETMQPGRSPSSPQWGQQQLSQHPETMLPTEQPASPAKTRSKKPALIALFLLVLLVLGGVGYVGYTSFVHSTPTQGPITTTTIHSTAISYAGVDVTILSVQHSQAFLDDPNVTSDGSAQASTAMVRLNLQAQNTMTAPVNMLYDKIARLVLPGGKIVNPIYVKAIPTIAPGATQPAKIDFVVPDTSKTDPLVLRLGASNEAQLDIPLTTNADMSMYGPKTEQMSGQVAYQGLNWSLVNATTQLSIDGQQASSGMRFVTVTLKVDNTLQQSAITGSPYDYLRLKAGNVTASPMDSTLPLMFPQGEKGKTGTVTFMVPQNATSFTLLFQQTGGFDAQTLSFQL